MANTDVELRQGDITTVAADAIVNAANSALAPGAGVCGAILRAGGQEIFDECARLGGCPTGGAVITGAGRLKAKHVIHAVAPVYQGTERDAQLLRGAYLSSLKLADEHVANSIAFPSLGTGVYGYPIEQAAPIALKAVADHARTGRGPRDIIFVLFSAADYDTYDRALTALTN
ncbi:MAG: macro domain-containing protein [Candidatus Eremiobacteraeota bacterium]|nr:macro domain-containing protein [Candidatus Eremiobacteraeota bacterium]